MQDEAWCLQPAMFIIRMEQSPVVYSPFFSSPR